MPSSRRATRPAASASFSAPPTSRIRTRRITRRDGKARSSTGSLYTQFGVFYDSIDKYQAYFIDALTGRADVPEPRRHEPHLRFRVPGASGHGQRLVRRWRLLLFHSELGNALIFDPDTGTTIQTDGNRQPYTPEYTFFAGMQIRLPSVGRRRVDAAHRLLVDRRGNRDAAGSSFRSLDSHEQVNLRLELAMRNWDIIGYVKNASDEQYIEAHGGPGYNAYVNPPRTWGVKVNYTF